MDDLPERLKGIRDCAKKVNPNCHVVDTLGQAIEEIIFHRDMAERFFNLTRRIVEDRSAQQYKKVFDGRFTRKKDGV